MVSTISEQVCDGEGGLYRDKVDKVNRGFIVQTLYTLLTFYLFIYFLEFTLVYPVYPVYPVSLNVVSDKTLISEQVCDGEGGQGKQGKQGFYRSNIIHITYILSLYILS